MCEFLSSLLNEFISSRQSQKGVGRTFAYWLGCEAPNRFAQDINESGLADYVFAFHDGDEIGPSMMSRVAKSTGLTPNDL
jgi:hypothetical protein